jgi:2-C-methyl-D-erythritol 4-phosphate cytidylyltransferase
MKQGTSVILLAGGTGSRMQSSVPKQYLTLGSKPIARHSFDLFLNMSEVDEIVVVCSSECRDLFQTESSHKKVVFALPGKRRQDSVYHGLQATSYDLICIHDAARPFIDRDLVLRVLKAGRECGAAAVGMPLKFTIKEIDPHHFVQQTPDRSQLWEVQTPQVLHRELLTRGFHYAHEHQLTVTDDVSLAELIQQPVKLVEGSSLNVKITVPSDLPIAEHLLSSISPCTI